MSSQGLLSAKKPPLPPSTRAQCSIVQGQEGSSAAEWVRIDTLRLWEDNPRDNDGKPVEEVAKSIAEDGQFGATIVARKADNLVLAGHTRIKAALSLGMDRVPVRYLDLPLRKAKKHALKDNKTAELAQWNDPKLAAVIAELRREEPDLQIPGFDPAEMDRLLREARGADPMALEETLAQDELEDPASASLTRADVPDARWPSDNDFDIPTLDLTLQADCLDLPAGIWGSVARSRAMRGTWLFYTEDRRFNSLLVDPSPVLNTTAPTAVEINFSVYEETPRALALAWTYHKRRIARWWQSKGLRIFVDLNVAEPHAEDNLLGVPAGWKAYATRGYTVRLEATEREYKRAQARAGTDNILFLVYGGGMQVKARAKERGWIWVPEQSQSVRMKEQPVQEVSNG
jgi:Domain of unknown function (DUF4417)/ParB-like nuclease domain